MLKLTRLGLLRSDDLAVVFDPVLPSEDLRTAQAALPLHPPHKV